MFASLGHRVVACGASENLFGAQAINVIGVIRDLGYIKKGSFKSECSPKGNGLALRPHTTSA
jgi:hypothetical protein